MKNCSEDCTTCEVQHICQALENLLDAIDNYSPKIPSDDTVKNMALDYIKHVGPAALNTELAKEIYQDINEESFHALLELSIMCVTNLLLSWEDKTAQLQVIMEAQEAMHGNAI